MFTCPIERNKAAYAAQLVSQVIASDAPDFTAVRKPRLFMLESEKVTYRQNRAVKQIERFLIRHNPVLLFHYHQLIGRKWAKTQGKATIAKVNVLQSEYRKAHGIAPATQSELSQIKGVRL